MNWQDYSQDYRDGYSAGYTHAMKDMVQRRLRDRKDRKKRLLAFAQRMLGFVLLVNTVIFVGITREMTPALFTVPLGFYILLTKRNYLDELLR